MCKKHADLNFFVFFIYKIFAFFLMVFIRFLKYLLHLYKCSSKICSFSLNHTLFFTFCIIILVVLYLVSSNGLPTFHEKYVHTSSLDVCLNDRLKTFQSKLNRNDIVIFNKPLIKEEIQYLQFIGNGFFGSSWQIQKKLFILDKKVFSFPVNISLLNKVLLKGYYSKEINGIDFTTGSIFQIHCFKLNSLCVSNYLSAFAHRIRPSILMQELKIHNPSNQPVIVNFPKLDLSHWIGVVSYTQHVRGESYNILIGPAKSNDGKDKFLVALAHPRQLQSYRLKASETLQRTYITAIRYYGPMSVAEQRNSSLAQQALEAELISELETALRVGEEKLIAEHNEAWQNIWRSGLSISHSLAPGAVNGDIVNVTLYYLLSHVPLLNYTRMNELGWHPGGCYNGHHTLQVQALWHVPQEEESLTNLIRSWLVTLTKQGCFSLVKLGVHGVLQAFLLSIGEILHTRDHLEFGISPRDLHRNYNFRNLRIFDGFLNIKVTVDDSSNRPQLFVSAGKGDSSKLRPLFVCDAGCLDAPIRLKETFVQLPVKLTRPRTAILYVTDKQHHIEKLKHAIHVREIIEAPAHDHHVMALHKHGHPFGGLPLLFWCALILLLLVFHLFLAKLIYMEYCRGVSVIPPAPPRSTNFYRTRHRVI